jgi:hypothetical protein
VNGYYQMKVRKQLRLFMSKVLRNTLKNISNNIMSVITTIKDKICLKPTDVVKENVYKPGNGIDINKYTISV